MREKIGVIAVAAKPIGPALGPASRPGRAGFVPFAVGGPIAGVAFLVTAARGRRAPRINDFPTDLADPPAFVPTSVGGLRWRRGRSGLAGQAGHPGARAVSVRRLAGGELLASPTESPPVSRLAHRVHL